MLGARRRAARLLANLTSLIVLAGCSSVPIESQTIRSPSPGDCGLEETTSGTSLSDVTVLAGAGPNTEPYLLWGIEKGCFQHFGLKITSGAVANQSERIAALNGGSADIVMALNTTLVQVYSNSGQALQVVAPIYWYSDSELQAARAATSFEGRLLSTTVLVTQPTNNIDSLEDLQGQSIGTISGAGAVTYGLFNALGRVNLGKEDVELVILSADLLVQAFERGELDAVMVGGAYAAKLINGGGKPLLYPAVFFYEPGPATMWVTSEEKLAENPELYKKFSNAVAATTELLSLPENRKDFEDFLKREYDLSQADIDFAPIQTLSNQPIDEADLSYVVPALKAHGVIETDVPVGRFLEMWDTDSPMTDHDLR